jgi:hypothetical protein
MSSICKIFVSVFSLAYLGALALLLIGTFGLFGQDRDPLSGVYLLPLGLPWNLLLDGFSDILKPWLTALAPGLNLIVLWLVCAITGRHVR